MEKLPQRLGLRTDPTIFFASVGLMVFFLLALIIAAELIGDIFAAGRT